MNQDTETSYNSVLSRQFGTWAAEVRQQESSNDYSKDTDKANHLGAYQMSRQALQAAGFQDENGHWTKLARSLGVSSTDDYLRDRNAQDIAFERYTLSQYRDLRRFLPYVGNTIGGITITLPGMLAGAHLVGPQGVEEYLESNGKLVRSDHSVPPVPVTRYLRKFSGPNFIYDKKTDSFVDGPAVLPGQDDAFQPYTTHAAVHRKINRVAVSSLAPIPLRIGQLRKRWAGAAERSHFSTYMGTAAVWRRLSGASFSSGRFDDAQAVIRQATVRPASLLIGLKSSLVSNGAAASHALQSLLIGRRFSMPEWRKMTGKSSCLHGSFGKRGTLPPSWLTGHAAMKPTSIPSVAPIAKQMNMISPTDEHREFSLALGHEVPAPLRPKGTNLRTERLARERLNLIHAYEESGRQAMQRSGVVQMDGQGSGQYHRNAESLIDEGQVGRTVERLLSRQARLPPSGPTGFDPRLSPAWGALKLPG